MKTSNAWVGGAVLTLALAGCESTAIAPGAGVTPPAQGSSGAFTLKVPDFEGEIVWDVHFGDEGGEDSHGEDAAGDMHAAEQSHLIHSILRDLPTQFVLTAKQGQTRLAFFDEASKGQPYRIFWMKRDAPVCYQIELDGKTYALRPVVNPDGKDIGPDAQAKESKEIREILGYRCQKVSVWNYWGSVDVWYTDEIGIAPSVFASIYLAPGKPLPDLLALVKGVPLLVEGYRGQWQMTARKIVAKVIDDATFAPPVGFAQAPPPKLPDIHRERAAGGFGGGGRF